MTKLSVKETILLYDILDDYRYEHENEEWYQQDKEMIETLLDKLRYE